MAKKSVMNIGLIWENNFFAQVDEALFCSFFIDSSNKCYYLLFSTRKMAPMLYVGIALREIIILSLWTWKHACGHKVVYWSVDTVSDTDKHSETQTLRSLKDFDHLAASVSGRIWT